MRVTRNNPITGQPITRNVPGLTPEAFFRWLKGASIHEVMTSVSDADIEFLLTGVTPEERRAFFRRRSCSEHRVVRFPHKTALPALERIFTRRASAS